MIEKMKMQTRDGVADNISWIAEKFPNCVTEKIDATTGEVKMAVDFDMLRQELSSEVVEGKDERYQFVWPDKKKAILLANAPVNATLRPCEEESEDFANTQNLYIEGDNLDVLKCLKETYLGKVKMIYILITQVMTLCITMTLLRVWKTTLPTADSMMSKEIGL